MISRNRKFEVDDELAQRPLDPMSAIKRLVEQWRVAGVPLAPSATEVELLALERALGTTLPADVAAFYRLANGMPDLEWDDHFVSFWSIAKILTYFPRRSGSDRSGSFTDVAIADFLIDSWFFDLRVRDGAVVIYIEGSDEEVESLSVLAKRYVESPESLPIL